MRASWLTWVWPILILLSTIAVTLLTFLFPEVGIRPIVIMCFLFIIPGMTVVRFFRTREMAVEWMLAIALSFAIDAFVAGIILYARQWSPTHIMSFLIGFCFSGAIAQLAIIRPATTVTKSVSLDIKDTKQRIAIDDASITKNAGVEDAIEDTEDREMSVDPEDPEDTKEQPVVLLPLQKSHLEDTQEKTITLEKPQLSGEKALKG